MAAYFRGRESNVRPHFKTHKCVNLAHMPLAAGAHGITCAKVEEAEVLVGGGMKAASTDQALPQPASLRG
jgi:D-serine deaminase-like pyridoxal phosphate-dependent protein